MNVNQTIRFLKEMIKVEMRDDQLFHIKCNIKLRLETLNEYYKYPYSSNELQLPKYDKVAADPATKSEGFIFGQLVINFFISIVLSYALWNLYNKYLGSWTFIFLSTVILTILGCIFWSIIDISNNKDYERYVEAFDKKNEQLVSEYRNRVAIEYQKLKKEYDNINKFYEASSDMRFKFYYASGIHSKYWNLESITAFLEYFELGICTSFKGANGAYARIETDNRYKEIMGKLDNIKTRLDKIDSHLVSLREEIKKNNNTIENMSNKIMNSLNTTNERLASIDYTNKINKSNIESYMFMKALGLIK